MANHHMRNIQVSLQSVEGMRKNALATGDRPKAARAEDLIVQIEQQIAALAARAMQPQEPEPEKREPSERSQMVRPHIFAINANPEFLNVVRVLLQDERYNVTTTNFVPHTFDQIAALQPSLLLVDLAIGKEAGWELMEQIHKEASTRNIPLIVVSDNQELLNRARQSVDRYGGKNFVAKPLDLDVLLETIQSLIGDS
ncbi:MAG: response regulator [Chloroflexota bacterium]|nr:response regulator [Chloroflexota bacterium]